jgi:hypothetical protein
MEKKMRKSIEVRIYREKNNQRGKITKIFYTQMLWGPDTM